MPVHKNKYFAPAISLILFAVIYEFGPDGICWFWTDQRIVAVVLVVASVVFWALLLQPTGSALRGRVGTPNINCKKRAVLRRV